ncbi:MAG: Fe-S cluster assembly sulfur transfer protein SufU [Candidatus Dormibacteria bacterium]
MEDLYREVILDHYRNPRNKGELDPHDVEHEDLNPLCGDRIKLELRIEDDRVADVRFSGQGCAISQASASMLTEMIKGKTLEEVRQIDRRAMLDQLGIDVSPARMKCAMLGVKTLHGGLWGTRGWPGEE